MRGRTVPVVTGLGVLLLAAMPLVLPPGLQNAAIQMLIAALFACAYNVLCGQAGMLSFGHAAYFGAGAFATVHAMNAFGGTGLLPTPWLPLAGALAGLVVGAIAGWFATQRTGAYFAMITLAIAELLHALAPHLRGWFGGEAGISSMRMPALGLTFGSTAQVYYLVLAWVLASVALLYFFTRTPLGRLALGLRENTQRLAFLGYDVHHLGVLVFAVSTMFSGVAGALQAINNESANYVVFDAGASAAVVLNTYIGGTQVFLGPALGAALMTFFGYAVSDLTRSWLLYQGILFVVVMMFVPDGLAGLFVQAAALRRRHGSAALLPVLALGCITALLVAAGGVFLVELLQRMFSPDTPAPAGAGWPPVAMFGRQWSPEAAGTWLLPAALLATGCIAGWRLRRRLAALRSGADSDAAPGTGLPLSQGGAA